MFKTQNSRGALVALIFLGLVTYLFVHVAGWVDGLIAETCVLGALAIMFGALWWIGSGE